MKLENSLNSNFNDKLDMSTKSNWNYLDSSEIIITQKYSNRFKNDAEKWLLLTIFIITFEP